MDLEHNILLHLLAALTVVLKLSAPSAQKNELDLEAVMETVKNLKQEIEADEGFMEVTTRRDFDIVEVERGGVRGDVEVIEISCCPVIRCQSVATMFMFPLYTTAPVQDQLHRAAVQPVPGCGRSLLQGGGGRDARPGQGPSQEAAGLQEDIHRGNTVLHIQT